MPRASFGGIWQQRKLSQFAASREAPGHSSKAPTSVARINEVQFRTVQNVYYHGLMPVDTENRKIWMAFHAGTPYRYLAQDSLASFQARSKNKEQRPHIMGRIILIDTKTASLDENPYNLALGTEYFICFVEPLKINSKQRSSGGTSSANTSLNTTSNTSVFSPGLAMGKNHPHSSHNAKISAISADVAVNMNAGVLEGETTSGKSEKNTSLSLQNPNHTPNA